MKTINRLYQQVLSDRAASEQQLAQIKSASPQLEGVVAQALASVVSVYAIDWDTEEIIASGSGFFLDTDLIITNYHLVEELVEVDVFYVEEEREYVLIATPDQQLRLAEVVFTGNEEEDLVILLTTDYILDPTTGEEVESVQDYPALSLSFDVEVGDRVLAIGNPLGETEGTILSEGTITAIREPDEEIEGGEVFTLQTDATISTGNSGGPLLNLSGEVVGVNTWGLEDPQRLNLAIAAEVLDDFLERFEEIVADYTEEDDEEEGDEEEGDEEEGDEAEEETNENN